MSDVRPVRSTLHLLMMSAIVLCTCTPSFATITFSSNTLTYSSPSDLGTTIDPSGQKDVTNSYGVSKSSFQALNPQVVAFNGAPSPTQTLRTLVANYTTSSTVTFTFPSAMYNYGSMTTVGRGSFSGSSAQDAISTVPVQNGTLYDWFDATITSTGGQGVQSIGFCAAFRNDQAVAAGQVLYTLSDSTTGSVTLPTLGNTGNPEYVFIGYTAPSGKTITRVQASRTSGAGGGYVSVDDLAFVMSPDTTAPAAVSNLSCSNLTTTSVQLNWTAPGDDGSTGTATSYDIRYSTSAINAGNFSSATAVTGVPAPAAAGTNQNVTVSGLTADTTYYFAMKTADEVPNWSAISNLPNAHTVDSVAPAAVSNLATGSITASSITLSWTAPGDNGSSGTATSYDIRYSTSTITAGNFSSATAVTGVPAPAAAGTNQNVTVSGLSGDTTYYFAMKTADEVPNWSTISNVPSAKTSDTVAPAAVSNLATSSPTGTSITLSWTAPGDNGSTGTATSYDIRYSTSTITAGNFSSATVVTGVPAPQVAGTNQNVTVSGLANQTTYYFAMKTADEVPNWSTISNVVSASTLDAVAPAAVSNLATSNPTSNSITLSWTAPGDDGSTGTAATYDIRYSTSTITTGNFSSATQVTGAPAPAAAGTNQNMVVSGLATNTTYYFAMKTADEVPNWSAISNVPTGATSGTITFANNTLTYGSPSDLGTTIDPAGLNDVATSYGISKASFQALNPQVVGFNGAPAPTQTLRTLVAYYAAGNTVTFTFPSAMYNCGSMTTLGRGAFSGSSLQDAISTVPVQQSDSLYDWFDATITSTGGQAVKALGFCVGFRNDQAVAAGQVLYTLSDASTDTVTLPALGGSGNPEYVFIGYQAPSGKTITRVQASRTSGAGGGYVSVDDLAFVMGTADTTAPAAVSNLSCSNLTATSVQLNWTAPGDDGNTGTATTYDIRYSTSAINAGNFSSATQVTGVPAPAAAGTNQNVTISGLTADTTYYFAMKTADEVPNWSTISNLPNAHTVDSVAPAAVSNLATSSPTGTSITLTWTAPGDNGSTGTATSYDIRYSTSTITAGNFSSATQVTGAPAPQVAGTNQNVTVSGLSNQTTYYFAMKTTDEVPNWSAISNVVSASTLDAVAPSAVSNLATSSPTSSSITLSWTAPGDDGSTGTATTYDIRYSTSTITAGNFSSATQVTGAPAPATAGTNQNMVVSGLITNTTYYFAMKTADEVPNWSTISNVPSGTTSAPVQGIIAFKRDAGLTAGGATDARFNSATVRTVTVADAPLYNMSDSRWCNGGRVAVSSAATNLLFKFDLSSIPANSTINLAQLRIYHTAGNGGQGNGGVGMVLTHDWIEGTITADMSQFPGAAGGVSTAHPIGYNTGANQDANGGTTGSLQTWGASSNSFFSMSTDVGTVQDPSSSPNGTGYHVIDVTSHVQQWVNGTKPNYGWALVMGLWDFHMSESGTAQEPVLFVDYTSSGGGDTTAPAAVSNLATSSPTSSSITLTWTAPGDDGSTGTATSYDIRYSTSQITNDTQFNSATQCTGEPTPLVAGTNQSFVVTGLSASTTYYFAMKTSDEVPNVSALSNSPSGTTSAAGGDTTAPAAVSNLATTSPTNTTITLTWTAPGDDGSTGTATTYDIRYSTSTINSGNWASATQISGEPTPLVAGTNQSMTITGLTANTTYYFAMKTADEVPNWSGLSNVPSGTTTNTSGNNNPILTAKDFKYKGYYIVQNGGDFQELYWGGGFTHRYVSGQLRFLSLSHIHNGSYPPLVEFAPPSSYGGTVTAKTNWWDNIWAGTGTDYLGWTGLWFEQAQNRLWTTSAVDYPDDTQGAFSKAIAVRTLNSDGTISNAAGPWGLSGIQQRRIYGGVQAVPSWFQSTYSTGPYATGWGGYASRMGVGASLGPTFYTFPEPTGYPAGNDTIPTSAFKTIMDHSASTLATDWYANGYPTTLDRGVRNSDLKNDYDAPYWAEPAPDGVGRWVMGDSAYNTGCWIETSTKQGFILIPKVCSGRAWYETSTLHCERQQAEIQVFDPNMLGQVAQGSRAAWNTYPTYRWQITDDMLPLGLGWGTSGNSTQGGPCGATYDSTTQTLYVYCQGGTSSNSYILVYEVGNGNAAVSNVATAETAVTGTVSGYGSGVTGYPGNRANTETADSVYETITEVLTGGTSQLEQKWTYNVTGGSSVVFSVKAYHNSNSDGDDFVFAYSTDGNTWTNMVTVTKTADDGNFQTYTMPANTSGTVYVRVRDSDRTAGHNNLDTIYIDEMKFTSNP